MKENSTLEAGTVTAILPSAMLRVRLDSGMEISAHVAEEFRRVATTVRPGDRVKVRRAERDPQRGAIVGRT